eukprot:CAMPEP_0201550056 /NCGR_PEP_ID=MMETSP0173_2-20130828/6472_1 /ASSEMBLY_ACC=CAM_ASM_000268 /TAXON_ID=218659 /ORGANISM="Vexillifera sp., Strain DIVA3 564/2" /LENGTH=216 /DNA_ID=CAMNT_0047959933 /DNA_START=239 /DNA_END=886 /DNA_ORIENTATION=+
MSAFAVTSSLQKEKPKLRVSDTDKNAAIQGEFRKGDKKVLPDECTSLVGREDEIFELFITNVRNILKIKDQSRSKHINYEAFEVCFTSQKSGTGKTRLGKEFFNQLKCQKEVFQDKIKSMSWCDDKTKQLCLDELDRVTNAPTQYHYFDLRDCVHSDPKMVWKLMTKMVNNNATCFQQALLDLIFQQSPSTSSTIFIHFDEVGVLNKQSFETIQCA